MQRKSLTDILRLSDCLIMSQLFSLSIGHPFYKLSGLTLISNLLFMELHNFNESQTHD